MKRLLPIALSLAATPALAQGDPHAGHNMPGMEMTRVQPATDSHAGHSMPGMEQPAAPVREQTTQPHAEHDMREMEQGSEPVTAQPNATGTDQSPGSAEPPPIAHDRPADRYFDPAAMAAAEAALMREGKGSYSQLVFDLAEYQFRDGKDGYRWEGEAWIGDLNRVVLRSKGEGTFGGSLDKAELQMLYSHALDPWWTLQVGLRQDIRPQPERTHLALGVEGLAPYFFHVTAAAFLSHKGEVTGRLEATYDQRITQRLILQPRAELDLSAQDMPSLRTGSGLSQAELGLRLRYEIKREFAPYIGVNWTWKTGKSADYAIVDGRETSERAVVAGVRFWF